LIINNEIITGPIYDRVGFAIGENDYEVARLKFNGSLSIGKKKIKIDNINQPRMLFSQVLIYTNKWGEKSPISKSKCKHIAIKNNKVVAIANEPILIPENGFVITGSKDILSGIKVGKKVKIDYHWYEPNKKRDLDNISSFGRKVVQDALVDNGILQNDGWNEVVGFSDTFFIDEKNPRIEVIITEIDDE
jgi:hypothetical protein